MRRYGDNVSAEEASDESEKNQENRVMYGGCGVSYGSFPQRVNHPKKRFSLDLLSLFWFKRKVAKEQKE